MTPSNYLRPGVRPATALSLLALLLTALAAPAVQAEPVEYRLSFADTASGATGSGSFLWDASREIMTALTWNFSGKTGAITDSALASTYHSWDPLAATYGELFFRYLTEPQAYLLAQHGLLSAANGVMPANVTGDYGFVAFGAEKTSRLGTYRFLNKDWSLASEGYVAATPVPEPSSLAFLMGGLGVLGAVARRRKVA